jgi:hypothetical protein
MKNNLYFLFAFLIITSTFSCTKENAIMIKFTNNTGYDLSDLVINDVPINNLMNSSSTRYKKFKEFTLDSGTPVYSMKYNLNGINKENSTNSFCASFYNNLENGKYEMEIYLVPTRNDDVNFRMRLIK